MKFLQKQLEAMPKEKLVEVIIDLTNEINSMALVIKSLEKSAVF